MAGQFSGAGSERELKRVAKIRVYRSSRLTLVSNHRTDFPTKQKTHEIRDETVLKEARVECQLVRLTLRRTAPILVVRMTYWGRAAFHHTHKKPAMVL